MSASTAYHNRSISPKEQALYDHLLAYAEHEAPQQLIERFRTLFIDGVGYPHRDVVAALDAILGSKEMEDYFHYILNRCCHILVNRWHSRPQYEAAIPALIDLFETGPDMQALEFARTRQIRSLHRVVSKFTETEQYLTLKRLAKLVENSEAAHHYEQPLGSLIQRYPYLYEHCLVSEDCPEEHQHHIRRLQAQAQRQFEVNLSQYVTFRVRQARLKKQVASAQTFNRLRPVANPTLLSDRELVASLNQFSGKVENGRSYQDAAQLFLDQSRSVSFRAFKRDLYDYLTESVDPAYGRRKFNKLLCQQLIETLPQNDDKSLNDFLLVRTCSQLLNFLVVESPSHPQHFVFIDLINNLGPLMTTGILLKIILLCRTIKPYLERRFSILFGHYETVIQSNVIWLVKMLENLNVALSVTFGSTDVSSLMAL